MTIFGMKKKLAFFLINNVWVGTRCFEQKRKTLNYIGFKIAEGTKIVGPIYCTANLSIGKDCWIGKNLIINGNGKVTIGDNCDIAPEVAIQTGGHEIGSERRRAGKGKIFNVTIKNGCWIGARSTILGGVVIENSAVVAACSCVTKNVLENTMVGGVPAKIIKRLEKEDEKY